jgi:hypothetical protein
MLMRAPSVRLVTSASLILASLLLLGGDLAEARALVTCNDGTIHLPASDRSQKRTCADAQQNSVLTARAAPARSTAAAALHAAIAAGFLDARQFFSAAITRTKKQSERKKRKHQFVDFFVTFTSPSHAKIAGLWYYDGSRAVSEKPPRCQVSSHITVEKCISIPRTTYSPLSLRLIYHFESQSTPRVVQVDLYPDGHHVYQSQ